MTILSHRRDHLELNRDRRGKCCNLNGRAGWVGLARSGKILGVQTIVDGKIFFHVREEDSDIDDVLPRRACVFQNEPHIFKNCAALCFNVVTDDLAGRIERDTGNFFAPALACANAREKQKVADAFRMRERAYRFRRALALEGFAHFCNRRLRRSRTFVLRSQQSTLSHQLLMADTSQTSAASDPCGPTAARRTSRFRAAVYTRSDCRESQRRCLVRNPSSRRTSANHTPDKSRGCCHPSSRSLFCNIWANLS